jgi:cell shape-determining protein MreC
MTDVRRVPPEGARTLQEEVLGSERRLSELESETKELREKLSSRETTVNAVVAKSIGVSADTGRRRSKKSGRGTRA